MHKETREKIKEEVFLDSTYLLDFEDYILDKYSLFRVIPIFKGLQLRLAFNKWNKKG